MSHNLEELNNRSNLTIAFSGCPDITLTHVFPGDEFRIKGLRNLPGGHLAVRVGEDDTQIGAIVGEDLFALREFLNELPEEAFVRPADPVEIPDPWQPGDVVVRTDYSTTYVRGPEYWSVHGVTANPRWLGNDRDMDYRLEHWPGRHGVERRGGKRVSS